MKGEYAGGDKDHHHHHHHQPHPNMFMKLHHQQQQQQQHQSQQQPPQQHPSQPLHLQHHHFQLATRECQTSEEADSRSPGTGTPIAATPIAKKEANSDAGTIEVSRRPRGRPPGSKNKPKPPVIITRETDSSMSPYVLELPGGADVVESISRFCRKRNTGICVLTASGTVANVTLRQPPSTSPGATVTFHGRFDILSLSATIFSSSTSSGVPPAANGFTISLAGPQGQIVGGMVVGPLLTAGTVYIIAASFNNPSFHRLPVAAEEEIRNSISGGGNETQSPPAVSGGGDGGHPPAGGESCAMSLYSCHMPSEVIWAPTARQPPPPHYG